MGGVRPSPAGKGIEGCWPANFWSPDFTFASRNGDLELHHPGWIVDIGASLISMGCLTCSECSGSEAARRSPALRRQ